MRMNLILGGVASSAVILASAIIYTTADRADAAVKPVEPIIVERVIERIVEVPVLVQVPARQEPTPIFADVSAEERRCLALNIYFESRGEADLGQEAIAWSTLNRVVDPDFPDTICGVVWQDQQYSWTHDGRSDTPKDAAAWALADAIAGSVLAAYGVERDPTGGAQYFHATHADPYWNDGFERVVQIDNHVFYIDRG
jgi:spore germination cell wall hydrolase CwlJ-like protein